MFERGSRESEGRKQEKVAVMFASRLMMNAMQMVQNSAYRLAIVFVAKKNRLVVVM